AELEDGRYGERAEDGGEHLKHLEVLGLVTHEIGEEIDRRVECPEQLADHVEREEEGGTGVVEQGGVKEIVRIASLEEHAPGVPGGVPFVGTSLVRSDAQYERQSHRQGERDESQPHDAQEPSRRRL